MVRSELRILPLGTELGDFREPEPVGRLVCQGDREAVIARCGLGPSLSPHQRAFLVVIDYGRIVCSYRELRFENSVCF